MCMCYWFYIYMLTSWFKLASLRYARNELIMRYTNYRGKMVVCGTNSKVHSGEVWAERANELKYAMTEAEWHFGLVARYNDKPLSHVRRSGTKAPPDFLIERLL